MSRVTRVTLTWRDGPSLSVILSEVSEPHELLSLISWPFPVLLCARGEAGGARRAAHTILCMCSQIRRNLRMFPKEAVNIYLGFILDPAPT